MRVLESKAVLVACAVRTPNLEQLQVALTYRTIVAHHLEQAWHETPAQFGEICRKRVTEHHGICVGDAIGSTQLGVDEAIGDNFTQTKPSKMVFAATTQGLGRVEPTLSGRDPW